MVCIVHYLVRSIALDHVTQLNLVAVGINTIELSISVILLHRIQVLEFLHRVKVDCIHYRV